LSEWRLAQLSGGAVQRTVLVALPRSLVLRRVGRAAFSTTLQRSCRCRGAGRIRDGASVRRAVRPLADRRMARRAPAVTAGGSWHRVAVARPGAVRGVA